jgi:hypothetical protein
VSVWALGNPIPSRVTPESDRPCCRKHAAAGCVALAGCVLHRSTPDSPAIFVDEMEGGMEEEEDMVVVVVVVVVVTVDDGGGGDRRRVHSDPVRCRVRKSCD